MFENEVLEDAKELASVPSTSEVERQSETEPSEALSNFERLNAEMIAAKKKRVKRTESQMIAALGGSALKEANYVADRVRKLEDKISELMGSVSEQARILILKDYPHLVRY